MWSIHNAIEMQKQGLPTTVICSSKFETLIKSVARTQGFQDFPIVTIPHPIAEPDADLIRQKADDALEDLINKLSLSEEKAARAVS